MTTTKKDETRYLGSYAPDGTAEKRLDAAGFWFGCRCSYLPEDDLIIVTGFIAQKDVPGKTAEAELPLSPGPGTLLQRVQQTREALLMLLTGMTNLPDPQIQDLPPATMTAPAQPVRQPQATQPDGMTQRQWKTILARFTTLHINDQDTIARTFSYVLGKDLESDQLKSLSRDEADQVTVYLDRRIADAAQAKADATQAQLITVPTDTEPA